MNLRKEGDQAVRNEGEEQNGAWENEGDQEVDGTVEDEILEHLPLILSPASQHQLLREGGRKWILKSQYLQSLPMVLGPILYCWETNSIQPLQLLKK